MADTFLNNPQTISQTIVYLYRLQTPEEQDAHATVEQNGQGYNGFDAEIMSSFAQQILDGKILTSKQISIAKLRLPKYKGQLANGAWQSVILPEPKAVTPKVVINRIPPGTLTIDTYGKGLVFYPNTYPSKQIQTIGFTSFSGGAWHQSRPSVNRQAVDDVCKMFQNVIIDPSVTEALNPKQKDLPQEILSNQTLFDYQKEAIEFQVNHPHSLIAMAPRLGKTITTIYSTQVVGCKRILVVAPLSLLRDWKNKIKKWSGENAAIVYKKQLLVPSRWTITNYDTLRLNKDKFFAEAWDAIIVDESLLVKNRHAKRTEVVKQLATQTKPKYMWLLSGAPMSRYYDDLWAQLNILNPSRFTSYWRFADRYCVIEPSQYSQYNLMGNKADAVERIHADLEDIYFSRTQEQVLDLPPWSIDNIPVQMTPYQDKLYGSMEEEFMADLGDGDTLLAPNHLAQMIRLIQIASNPLLIEGKDASPKWDAVEELLQFEKLPAIIWTAFIPTATALVERLTVKGYKVAKLTGATKQEDRQPIVEAFQNGDLDVIVAHPAVGKYGLDLYKAQTVIYLERTHDGDAYYQSLNRVRHIESKISPHIIHLIAERSGDEGGNTVDYVIDKVLQGRREDVLKLTTGTIRKLFQEMSNGK